MSKNEALVVGATGIVGLNLANLLKEQAGWPMSSPTAAMG
jgi:aspartate-semialdehyde dehydrogenase